MNSTKPDVATYIERVRADIFNAQAEQQINCNEAVGMTRTDNDAALHSAYERLGPNARDVVLAGDGPYEAAKRLLETAIEENDSALRGSMWLSVAQIWRETRSPMVLRAVADVISTVTEGCTDAALAACLNIHELRIMIADVVMWGQECDAWVRRMEEQIHDHKDGTHEA